MNINNADTLAFGALALLSWRPLWGASEVGRRLLLRLIALAPGRGPIEARDMWLVASIVKIEHSVPGLRTAEQTSELQDRLMAGLNLTTVEPLSSPRHYENIAQATVALYEVLRETQPSKLHGLRMPTAPEGSDKYLRAHQLWARSIIGDAEDSAADIQADEIRRSLSLAETHRANFVMMCALTRALASYSFRFNSEEVDEHGLPVRRQDREDFASLQMTALLQFARGDDGSWDGSVWDTAWALLTAHDVLEVQYLRMSIEEATTISAEVRRDLLSAERRVIAASRAVRVNTVPLLFATVAAEIALIVVLLEVALREGFAIVTGLLGAGVIVAMTWLWKMTMRLWRMTQISV